jgi:hypothetical protein
MILKTHSLHKARVIRQLYFVQQLTPIWNPSFISEQLEKRTSPVNGFKERTQSTTTFLFVYNVSPALCMLSSVCNTVCKLLKPTGFAEGQFRKIIGVEHLDQDRAQLHYTDPCLVLLPALLSRTSHTARFQTRCYSYATTSHIVHLCYLAPSVEVE